MTNGANPAATDHIPWFMAAPDGSDTLLAVTTFVVLAATFAVGILFFKLHSLPERLGHKKFQFEIVAVLTLLSLFTHIHLFWVIALLLALIDIPDFQTPLQRIAASVERISGAEPGSGNAATPPDRLPPRKES